MLPSKWWLCSPWNHANKPNWCTAKSTAVSHHIHTHTRLMACGPGLPGWAGTSLDFTEARDSEWQWHQLGHMQVCTSFQTDNLASTPPLSFLQARCPSCRPTNSVKALKAHRGRLYVFVNTKPRDRLGRTPPNWPILYRMGRRTLINYSVNYTHNRLMALCPGQPKWLVPEETFTPYSVNYNNHYTGQPISYRVAR